MKKDLTELVFILDKSGSMFGLESDTIGGFNSLIEKQKKEPGEAIVSTILFNHKVEVIHDRINLNEVSTLTENEYVTDGCTALLDAIGSAITKIVSIRKNTPEEEHPEKTMFIITTDGMENSSSEYSYSKIKKMIKLQQEKYNWEFIFLAANIDSAEVADSIGIARENAVSYCCDAAGIDLNYECVSSAISELRFSKKMSEEWRKKIDEDFENRN